ARATFPSLFEQLWCREKNKPNESRTILIFLGSHALRPGAPLSELPSGHTMSVAKNLASMRIE
ncbi:MAG: hypothetical protein ACQEVA_06665, partial [Myxococcota bacterium]